MKKKITTLLILFMIIISGFVVVHAGSPTTDAESGKNQAGSSCDGDMNACWSPCVNSNGVRANRGMRVTLMKTDGTRVGEATNVFRFEYFMTWLKSNNHYYFNGNCNKVNYLKGQCSLSPKLWTTKGSLPYNIIASDSVDPDTGYSLKELFSYFGVKDFDSDLDDWQLAKIWNSLEENGGKANADKLSSLIRTLFGESVDLNKISANPEELNDLWIIIEPLTIIRYRSNYYVGTHQELQSLDTYSFWNGSKINTVIGRSTPCAIYSTGNIIDKLPNAPGVNASNRTYFNGAIVSIDESATAGRWSGNFKEVCNQQVRTTLNEYYMKGNAATGIGIVKFSEIVGETSCSKIENNLVENLNTFKSNLKSYYESGGVNKILNEYKNGIAYKENGKTVYASTKWYVNECTCYGALEYYNDKTGKSLSYMDKNAIKSIFDAGYFTAFNNSNSLFATSNNKNQNNPQAGGVTPWTYEKYEALECPGVDFGKGGCAAINFSGLDYKSVCGNTRSCRNSVNKCMSLVLAGEDGFNKSISKNASLYKTCLVYFNIQHGTNYTYEWYKSCGDPNGANYNCTPQYDIGTCIGGDDVYYSDQVNNINEDEYWKNCIFNDNGYYDISKHKESNKNATYTYYDKEISGPATYCEIYCTETMVTNFDTSVPEAIEAGHHFIWSTHYVNGSRTCKTKPEIKYDQFEKDLLKANNEVVDTYVQWQLEIEKADAIKNATVTKSSPSCSCVYISNGIECCTASHYVSVTCKDVDEKDGTVTREWECGGYVCDNENYTRYDLYTASFVDFGVDKKTAYGKTKYASWGPVSWCNGGTKKTTKPTTNVTGLKREYEKAVITAQTVIKEMQMCYNDGPLAAWTDNLYNVEPKATIEYTDGKYSYKGELELSNSVNSIKVNSSCEPKIEELVTGCSGTSCTIANKNMQKCTMYSMTKTVTSTLDLEDEVFRYVNKYNQISFSGDGLSGTSSYNGNSNLGFSVISGQYTGQGYKFNYIDLGYSNFPIAFSTKPGTYDGLKITYSNLGHIKKGNTKADVDYILSSIDRNNYGNWQCEFEVYDDLIPGPPGEKEDDILVVFRPIDLNSPFPDITSQGRETGSNWCYGTDYRLNCSYNNSVVTKYITNNRGVTTTELYEQTPMYSFTLTPAAIIEIRRYNENNNYGSHNGYLDGNYYSLTCNKGTGRTCISDYLTHLIDKYAVGLKGTCKEAKFRNPNDQGSFENCRYTGTSSGASTPNYTPTTSPSYSPENTQASKPSTSKKDEGPCLIKGTKIKLADGTEKNIEDITYNDLLLVWDFEHGEYTYQYPVHIEKEGTTDNYQRTTFSDGSILETYGYHGIFSLDDMEVVSVDNLNKFHVGTKVAKVVYENGEYKFKEITVEKIETIEEDTNFYNVITNTYYNVVSNDILTTFGDVIVGNMYGFNNDLTWKANRQDVLNNSNNLFEYELLKDTIPYYMFKGLRASEFKYLLNLGYFELEDLPNILKYFKQLNSNILVEVPTDENGNRIWMVTTSDDVVSNKENLYKEGSYYTLKEPLNKENFVGWYETSEGKYYKPGDVVKVESAMHFIAK